MCDTMREAGNARGSVPLIEASFKPQWVAGAIVVFVIQTVGCGGTPRVVLREAPPLNLPGVTVPEAKQVAGIDCNNPAHWDGDTLYVFQSTAQPYRSQGPDMFHLSDPSQRVTFDNDEGWLGGRWMEATYKDDSGLLYGWYHHEQVGICPERKPTRTAPRIGAAVSSDNGLNWHDLGIVLAGPPDALRCDTANDAFAGGEGDFSVILDRRKEYFYFFFDSYHTDVTKQGVCVARMRYTDRNAPSGKARKWCDGHWSEPGLGGRVTPIFRTRTDWHRPDADSFWGPSIHWNTWLRRYVILLNHARDSKWTQEGAYVTFNPRLDDPRSWTPPVKILDGVHYYPQVIGLDKAGHETDKLAGRVARLFVTGKSRWEIIFLRPGETDTEKAKDSASR
jgi:hypothetical protein